MAFWISKVVFSEFFRYVLSDFLKALEYYKREKFDLLITDYVMPEMSGRELIAQIKAIDSDIPAVVITGYPLVYPAETARAQGIDGYLKKPFRVNHLKEMLGELFAQN